MAVQMNEKLSEETASYLSVKEAAEQINERPGVVRNWLRELKNLIPVIIGEHGYRYFDQEGLLLLEKIKKWRNEDQLSLKQIEDKLAQSTLSSSIPTTEATEKALQELDATKEQLMLQKNFNDVLVQQLKKQQEEMDRQHLCILAQQEQIDLLEKRKKKEHVVKKEEHPLPTKKQTNLFMKLKLIRLFTFR